MTARPERFTTRPNRMEGMRWDGTAEGATAIIDWVLAGGGHALYSCTLRNGECTEAEHDHLILVRDDEQADTYAEPGHWVIRNLDHLEYGFFTWPGDSFDKHYDLERTAP